jgi:uncharacterized protein (DUF983 family)
MSPNQNPQRPPRSLASALVRLRCPRCRQGRLFRSWFQMADPCTVCGLLYEREPGYFMGALYFSYFLGVAAIIPIYLLLWLVLPNIHMMAIGLVCFVLYLPLTPIIFRYSRALWLYWDRWTSPSEASTPEGWANWKQDQEAGTHFTRPQ